MTKRLDLADLVAIAAEILDLEPHDLLGVFDVDVALDVLASVWSDPADCSVAEAAARLLVELITRPVLPAGHLRLAVVAVVTFVERNQATISLEPAEEAHKLVHAISVGDVVLDAVVEWMSARVRPWPAGQRVTDHAHHELEPERDRLVQENLKLVVSLARRYEGSGLPLLDLIRHGNSGLVKAAERYDGTKGFKFSTYATWWIRQSITRAIANARAASATIRRPAVVALTAQELQVLSRVAAGREPSEIANDLFISRRTVINHIRHAAAKLQEILRAETEE